MKKIEFALVGLFLVGVIFQVIPLAGGSLFIILSLSILSIFYFGTGYLLLNDIPIGRIISGKVEKPVELKRSFLAVAGGFFCAVLTIGILFRVQGWPGPVPMILFGLAGLVVCCVITWFAYPDKTKAPLMPFLTRTAFWGVTGLLLLTLSPTFMMEIKYREDPDYVKLIKELHADPGNEELQKKLYDYRHRNTDPTSNDSIQ